jgi:glycosyltransferase involved in cell wall biosynthesis
MSSLVSVVIPSHNYAQYLGAAIESTLRQRYHAVEIIVVDDGSTDETPSVLTRFAGRVQVVHLDGQGVARARNAGLARASGAFVVFLDADDLLLRDGVGVLAEYLSQHPDVDAVYGRWYVCDLLVGTSALATSQIPPAEVFPRILLGNVVTTPSAMMVRRPALEAVGGFHPAISFTADWELWLRLARRGHRFGAVLQPVAIYRVHGNSMTGNLTQAARDAWYVLDTYFSDPTLPVEAQALRLPAYFNMSAFLGKLHLEQGDEEGARALLQQALDFRPEAADSVSFYYRIARAMWRGWQFAGKRDVHSAAEAVTRFAVGLTTVTTSRKAAVHLAVGLLARRAGAQHLALHHLGMAVGSAWRVVAARTNLPIASRICLPQRMVAPVIARLRRLGLRRSFAGPIPQLVSTVMASPHGPAIPPSNRG